MTTRTFIGLVAALGGLALVAQAAGAVVTQVNTSETDLTFSKENGYDIVGFPGNVFDVSEGEPSLPAKRLLLIVPAHREVKGITILTDQRRTLEGTFRILPAPAPLPVGERNARRGPSSKKMLYDSSEPYPPAVATIVNEGYCFGHHVVTVEVWPLQYLPSEGKLVLHEHVVLSIDMGGWSPGPTPVSKRRERTQRLMERMLERLVSNPGDVQRYGIAPLHLAPEGRFSPGEVTKSPDVVLEYIVVTDDSLVDRFQPLVEWKTTKGVPAAIFSTSWIQANYYGSDLQERIRRFIQDAYQNWGVVWVLLGGDTELVPARKGWAASRQEPVPIPTDLYYAALDGNWNADGDWQFGDTTADDAIPDVWVGRFPARTKADVDNLVQKVLTYERNPDRDYLTKMLLMGASISDDCVDVIGQQMKDLIANLSGMPDEMTLWKLYSRGEGDEELSRDNALRCLNEGFHLINHYDHGGRYFVGTGHKCGGGGLYRGDMSSLANGDRLSILFSFSCETNAFEYDCVAERFLLSRDGGGVAMIGHAVTMWTDQHSEDLDFFSVLFNDSIHHLGAAFAAMQVISVGGRYVDYAVNLLGDPELSIWTAPPRELAVSTDTISHQPGPSTYTVTVKDEMDLLPLEGALVCLSKSGEDYVYGRTGPDGTAVFTFSPDTEGEISVAVTAHNYLPFEGNWVVQPIGEPHLYIASYSVEDGGNGLPEAGEWISLAITVGNGGQQLAESLTVWLGYSDTIAVVPNDTTHLAMVPAGGSAQVEFDLSLSPFCLDGGEAPFGLTLIDGEGREWRDDFSCVVYAPELVHSAHVVDDDNGNGVPEPGEGVDLGILLANAGRGLARGISATLQSLSQNIEVDTAADSLFLGDIEAGATAQSEGKFALNFLPGYVEGDSVSLLLRDEHGRAWSHSFEFSPPERVDSLWAVGGTTSIQLFWSTGEASDLAGYNVYRGNYPTGSFSKVNSELIRGSAYYQDADLEEVSTYRYLVTVQDLSANESLPSDTLVAWTIVGQMNGWPIRAGGDELFSSPVLGDVDGDGTLEIFIGSFDGTVYAWRFNGQELYDIDGDPSTVSGFARLETGGSIWGSPSLGDIDGDGRLEVVATSFGTDGKVYAWHVDDFDHDGRPDPVDGWPKWVEPVMGGAALGDLDGDGNHLEVVVVTLAGNVHVLDHAGASLSGWPHSGLGSYTYSTPSVADLDGDGDMEIIVAGGSFLGNGRVWVWHHDGELYQGAWPVDVGQYATPSPAVGDIDDDTIMEIVVGSCANRLYALEPDGTPTPGWEGGVSVPLHLGGATSSSPSLADLDGDDRLEVIFPGAHGIYVWNYRGEPVEPWPLDHSGTWSSAVVGDIDGDEDLEVLVGSKAKRVCAYHHDGRVVEGWPASIGDMTNSTPALGDLDNDGDMEVVVGCKDSRIYVWDCQSEHPGVGGRIEWGMFKHDRQRTGFYHFVTMGVDESPSEGSRLPQEVRLSQNYPNPFNPITDISYTLPVGTHVKLEIFNILGQRVATLVDQRQRAGRHSIRWDARDLTSREATSGIYLYRLSAGNYTVVKRMALVK